MNGHGRQTADRTSRRTRASGGSAHSPSHAGNRAVHSPPRRFDLRLAIRSERLWCDISLVLLFFVAPLFMGGRHTVGLWVYGICVFPAVISLVRKSFSPEMLVVRWPVWLLLGCWLALPILQLLPLTQSMANWMGNGYRDLGFDGALQEWSARPGETLSLVPSETVRTLPVIGMYVGLFLALQIRLKSLRETERILMWLALSGGVLALVALLQVGFDSEKFLGIYKHPVRDAGDLPRGTFQNENHLCSLLAMIVPLAAYFVLRVGKLPGQPKQAWFGDAKTNASHIQWLSWLFGIVLVLIFTVVYATPSRGGAVLVACGLLIPLSLLIWHWGLRGVANRSSRLLFVVWGLYGVSLSLGVLAFASQMPRWSYWRAKIWDANLAMFADFPVIGIGLGGHAFTYRAYFDEYFPQTFSHAESSLLQVLSETGLVGAGLVLAAVGMLGMRALLALRGASCRRERLLLTGVVTGVLVSLVHACFDFPWHIPACAVPLITLLAIVYRLPDLFAQNGDQPSVVEESGRNARPAIPVFVFTLAVLMVWGTYAGWRPSQGALAWDEYRRLKQPSELVGGSLDQSDVSGDGALDRRHQQMVVTLASCLQADPQHIQANVRLAELLLQASVEQGPGKRQQRLLARVQQLALRVGTLCPTHSAPPMLLAQSHILQGADVRDQESLLNHSLKLRPVDSRVMTQLALLHTMNADLEAANQWWGRALEADPGHAAETFRYLLLFYSPSQVLSRFEPRLPVAETLLQVAVKKQNREETRACLRYVSLAYADAALAAPSDRIATQYFETAYRFATQTYDDALITMILTKHLDWNPSDIHCRIKIAKHLLRLGESELLQPHLQYCVEHAAANDQVRKLRMQADRLGVQRPLRR